MHHQANYLMFSAKTLALSIQPLLAVLAETPVQKTPNTAAAIPGKDRLDSSLLSRQDTVVASHTPRKGRQAGSGQGHPGNAYEMSGILRVRGVTAFVSESFAPRLPPRIRLFSIISSFLSYFHILCYYFCGKMSFETQIRSPGYIH